MILLAWNARTLNHIVVRKLLPQLQVAGPRALDNNEEFVVNASRHLPAHVVAALLTSRCHDCSGGPQISAGLVRLAQF